MEEKSPENRNVEFLYLPIFILRVTKGGRVGNEKKLTYHNFYFYLLLLSPILVVYILFCAAGSVQYVFQPDEFPTASAWTSNGWD